MNTISLVDETLDRNLAHNYILSIQNLPDGFSFSVMDSVTNKFIGLFHVPEKIDLDEIIAREEILSAVFRQVKVLFYNKVSTLIPGPLFLQESQDSYADFNFTYNFEEEKLMSNKIKNLNSHLLFPVEEKLIRKYTEVFPNASFYHQGFPFLESIIICNKNKSVNDIVFAMINKNMVDLCVYKSGSVELYNTFSYSTNNELIYYLLNIYETFQLNPEKTPLQLQGMFQKNDSLIFSLRKYIREIVFDKPLETIAHSYKFNEIHLHPFTNLLNLSLCE